MKKIEKLLTLSADLVLRRKCFHEISGLLVLELAQEKCQRKQKSPEVHNDHTSQIQWSKKETGLKLQFPWTKTARSA